MPVCQQVHPPTTGCCTWRQIGPVGVVDEAGRLAMVVAGKSRTEGIENVPTTVLDPPQAGGVKVEP